MKLPITDQFLLDVFNFLSNTGDVLDFIINPHPAKFSPGPKNPIFKKYRKEKGAKEFAKLIYYLKRKNYIQVRGLKGNKGILLTRKGLSKVLTASFKSEKKSKRKDGKWIMIIFDIPRYKQKSRNLLRSVLENLEYKILQHSVWVTPYDVSEKTERLLQMYSLDKYVKIFLIEELQET